MAETSMGKGFGQVEAVARYYAMRQTPRVLSELADGHLIATYSGVDRRGGAESLRDLAYAFMPASELLPIAGRIVDSVVGRDAMAGAASKSVYAELTDEKGRSHRVRAAVSAVAMVERLTDAEVFTLLEEPPLKWSWNEDEWLVRAFPGREFEHAPLIVVTGRPVSQSIYAATPVTAWQAELVALLTNTKNQQ